MKINNIPTKAEGWSTSEIILDREDDPSFKKTVTIMIVHNIPLPGNINSIHAAVDNWLVRTSKFTDQSLVNYINSKTYMSGHQAMTVKEFNEKYK